MFRNSRKQFFYYGEGTDHKVALTPQEAWATNNLRILDWDETTGHCRVNLTPTQMKDYNRAATRLNAYLENHTVFASEEFLAENDILRPVN